MQLKSYVLDTKFNDKKRGYSCYFAKTRECCVIGQEATYQLFRIQVSVVLWTLAVLSVIVGIPYILFVRLKALKLQEHSNRHQVWASCILLTFIVLSITFRFWYISYDRYYEASATADFKVNYVLVVVMLPSSFLLCSIVACFCDTICGHFGCFDCYNNCKLELSSCICPCKKPWIARILTYMIIGLVFNALHLLILCGYAIMLAIVASPFHAMPVLLLYLSCIYMFVITVSESMKKSICVSLTIVVPTNAILSVLIIWSYFTMVAMIGEYSKDEGLWSVVGGFLPVLINILLGYFIREIVNLLSPKVKID